MAVGGRVLGEAFVVISPDTDSFLQELTAKVKAAVGAVPQQDVKVGADTTPVTAAMTRVQSELAAVTAKIANIKIGANDTALNAAVSKMLAKVALLDKQMRAMELAANPAKLDAVIARESVKLAGLQQQLRNLEMGANTSKIDTAMAREVAATAGLQRKLSGLQLTLNDAEAAYELKYLETQAEAIRKALAKIPGDIDDTLLNKKLDVVVGRIGVLRSDAKRIELAGTTTLLFSQLTAAEDRLVRLRAEAAGVRLMNQAQIAGVQAQVAATTAEIGVLRAEADKVRLGGLSMAEITSVAAGIAGLNHEVEKLSTSLAGTAIGPPGEALSRLRDQAAKLSQTLGSLDAEVTDAAAVARLASLQVQSEKLKATLADLSVGGDPVRLAQATRDVASLAAGVEKLTPEVAASAGTWQLLTGWLSRFSAANQGIGWTAAIGGIAGWHIVLDAAIEAMIIAVGVTAALGAAFAGVYPAVDQLAYHQKAAMGVMTAYHVDAGVLAGSLDKLQKSLAPQVIEAFGGALNALTGQTSSLSRAAHEVVDLVDTWIAKLDLWSNHQKTLGGIMQAGVGYLQQLGKAAGTFAQAIDNLLTKDPGVAHYLLDIIQGIAGVLNLFSRLPGPIVTATLLFHGLWVWVSVLGGVFSKMTAPIVSAVSWIMKQGAASTVTATATSELAAANAELTAAVTALTTALTGEAAAEKAVAEGALADTATQTADAVASEADAAASAASETSLLGRAFGGALGALKGFGAFIADLATTGLSALGGALRTAGAALATFGRGLLALLANPLTWFVLATAAIVGMAIEARKATPDVQKLIDTLNQKINSDSASQAMTDISDSIGQVNSKISAINSGGGVRTFNQNWSSFGGTWANISAEVTTTAGAFGKALGDIPQSLASWPNLTRTVMDFGHAFHDFFGHPGAPAEMANDISKLNTQINNWLGADKNLFAETGSLMYAQNNLHLGTMTYTQSLTLMNMAGVRATDSLAVMGQKVANLVAGYNEMSAGGTQLQASINAVTFATEMQDSKVTTLNQGWDSFFKLVSGGSSDFLNFAKQVNGMNESFSGATQGAVALTISNGKVSESVKSAAGAATQGKASMTGLNDASLAAQQTLLQTASSANTQMDSLTSLAAAAGAGQTGLNQLQRANKDMLSTMLPAAQGSQQMTDVLYALAQRGGYKGADSFKALSEWVGKTKHPMQDLQGIVTTMTTKAGNLATDVQNLSVALGQNLTQAMTGAIMMASGGQKAMNAFATSLIHGYTNSGLQQKAALELGQSLLLATGNVNDAKTQFLSFAQGALHLTTYEANALWSEIAGKLTPVVNGSRDAAAKAQTAFENWAGAAGSKGLGLTKAQADTLWTQLTTRLGPEMGDLATVKATAAQIAFEDFAGAGGGKGLGLTQKQADALWTQLTSKLGPTLDGLSNSKVPGAKNKFIDWAENGLGLTQKQAAALWTELTTKLQPAIDNLHGKNIAVNMDGTGKFTIGQMTAATNPYPGGISGRAAAGMYLHPNAGVPGRDSVPIMAMPGELVVPTNLVPHVAPVLSGKIPGFAGGGLVRGYQDGGTIPGVSTPGVSTPGFSGRPSLPAYSGNLTPAYITDMAATFEQKFGNAMVTAMRSALTVAEKAAIAAGTGTGTAGDIVSYARSFLGMIPYVWGGTTLGPAGADCSGFTSSVFKHFGYTDIPRTSEQQGAWVTQTKQPQAGGLAFFNSPAGGPPPGHVGIVTGLNSMISQAGPPGVKGPTVGSLTGAMYTGVPPGGFAPAGGGAATGGGAMSASAIAALWTSVGGPAAAAADMARIAYAESGDVPSAVQKGQPPGLTGWGLWQITPTSGISQNGAFGNLLNASNNARAALSLYKGSGFGPWASDPVGASLVRSGLTYAAGGLVPGAAQKYDKGGVLPPGMTLAVNNTGRDETVIPVPPHQAASIARFAAGGVAGMHPLFHPAADAPNLHLHSAMPTNAVMGDLWMSLGGVQQFGAKGWQQYTVPGFAAGGIAGYQQKLGGDQYAEILDYNAFRSAALYALAHAAKGSAVSRYHTSITDELVTLAKRQASEAAAYKPVAGAGVTAAEISHFITMIKDEITTTKDIGLGKVPGGTLAALRNKLTAMQSASASEPALVKPPGAGPAIWPAWAAPAGTVALGDFWAQLVSMQKAEAAAYATVAAKFKGSLSVAKPGSWDYVHMGVIRSELATLATRQNAEVPAYNALLKTKGATGLPPGASVLSAFLSALKSVAVPVKDVDLNHYPGGWPTQMWTLWTSLRNLYEMAGSKVGNPVAPFSTFAPPPLPKRGTPEYITLAGIYGWYDRGGILPPGLTLAYNGTGRNEVVSPVPPGGVIGPGGMSPGEMQIINRLDKLLAVTQANPAAFSAALNGVAGTAASRGYYGAAR